MQFLENCYGSGVTLLADGCRITGTYLVSSPDDEPNVVSLLEGHLQTAKNDDDDDDGGETVIKGTWRHTGGLLTRGDFELRGSSMSNGELHGWWWTHSCPEGNDNMDALDFTCAVEKHKWAWLRQSVESVTSVIMDTTDIEPCSSVLLPKTSKLKRLPRSNSLKSVSSVGSAASNASMTSLSSAASQLADLHLIFLGSIWMERYGMLCAWICFWQTLFQLISSLLQWQGNIALNIVFNLVYSCLYASFLYFYVWMTQRPRWTYVAGVALYLLGYATFVAVYWPGLPSEVVSALYISGSGLFLAGSISLTFATCPVWTDLGLSPQLKSPLAALFWGSLSFLIGSVLFELDSLGFGNSRVSTNLGLVIFFAGRVFFIRGSQTSLCDAFFRRTSRRRLHRQGSIVGAGGFGAFQTQKPSQLRKRLRRTLSNISNLSVVSKVCTMPSSSAPTLGEEQCDVVIVPRETTNPVDDLIPFDDFNCAKADEIRLDIAAESPSVANKPMECLGYADADCVVSL